MTDRRPSLSKCTGRTCRQYIVWMRTENGKAIPVDPESVDEGTLEWTEDVRGRPVPLFDAEEHVAHWATCPDANDFRKQDRP